MTGNYEPDSQFYYENKKPVPAATKILGSTFRRLKVDEGKIDREYDQYVYTTDKDQDEYLRRMITIAASQYFVFRSVLWSVEILLSINSVTSMTTSFFF